jgi:hypothetical protein
VNTAFLVLRQVPARCPGRVGATASLLAELAQEIEARPAGSLQLASEGAPIELYELLERR